MCLGVPLTFGELACACIPEDSLGFCSSNTINLLKSLFCLVETGFLTSLEVAKWASLAGCASPVQGFKMHATTPGFFTWILGIKPWPSLQALYY